MKLNDKVEFAKVFAAALHKDRGQTYDNEPYAKHLQDVVDVLLKFDVIVRFKYLNEKLDPRLG